MFVSSVGFGFIEDKKIYDDLIVTFTFEIEAVRIKIVYTSFGKITVADWTRFRDCLKLKNGCDKLWFCGSNGEISIGLNFGIVEFQTAKFGINGNGEMFIALPKDSCLYVFDQIVNYLNQQQFQ